ncbi:hypothetical protein GCM10010922_21550 [Microbacterium sorbitolivorans]|uniref:DUF6153 family protein n=1 Tax=Microbacterium sorbitolivorans TaxID=1867410 RepID=UPI0013B05270|nr:DUF6153 family protein [Microbacterium sorbitolivorans]GGF45524.1 hypothetical protein GCM10010922_21550 [Microbacterium sorbitolivorans]
MSAAREQRVVSTTVRRVLLSVGLTLLVVTGLLGMHALSVGHTLPAIGHGQTVAQSAHSATGHDAASVETALMTPLKASPYGASIMDEGGGSCAGDGCGGMSHDHAMQMMMCVLALLSVALVLIAPRLLRGWLRPLPSLLVQVRVLLRSLPLPRPPSLLVLSISRT